MKLSNFYSFDPGQRLTITMRTSTLVELEQYRAFYAQEYGKPPSLPALLEQVARQFMAEDRGFQQAKDSLATIAEASKAEDVEPIASGSIPVSL